MPRMPSIGSQNATAVEPLLIGVDFTSRPTARKPITMARGHDARSDTAAWVVGGSCTPASR